MVSQALTLTMKTNYKGYIRTGRNASEGKKRGGGPGLPKRTEF